MDITLSEQIKSFVGQIGFHWKIFTKGKGAEMEGQGPGAVLLAVGTVA
jgi:hypothetical protein